MVSPIIVFVAGAAVGYIAGYSTPKPTVGVPSPDISAVAKRFYAIYLGERLEPEPVWVYQQLDYGIEEACTYFLNFRGVNPTVTLTIERYSEFYGVEIDLVTSSGVDVYFDDSLLVSFPTYTVPTTEPVVGYYVMHIPRM